MMSTARCQHALKLKTMKSAPLSNGTARESPDASQEVNSATLPSTSGWLRTSLGQSVSRLLDRLPAGRLTRSVAVLAGSTVLGQAVGIAASPLLTRLYSPAEFGAMGVYSSILAITLIVASLRYELAIPLAENDEDAAAIVVLSLAAIALTVSIMALGVWWLRAEIIQWTNTPLLSRHLWLLPVGFAAAGVYQTFSLWATRKKAFGLLGRTRLSQGLASVVTKTVLFPFGLIGLLLGSIAAVAAGVGSLACSILRDDRDLFRTPARRAVSMAVRYRRFPQVSSISGIINAAGLHLPMLMLAYLYGPIVAGQFALVRTAVIAPTGFLGQAVGQVYLGEGASLVRTSSSALHDLFVLASKRLLAIAAMPMLLLVTFGPSLFTFAFGPEWEAAGQFARPLALLMAFNLVVAPLGHTLNLLERQVLLLVWDCFRLMLVLAGFAMAGFYGWSPVTTVAVYSGMLVLAYVILWFVLRTSIRCAMHKGPEQG